jgi:(R)-citramalate synthase
MTGKTVETEVRSLTIMDTTLRDGEQTTGVSFSEGEKLSVAKVLLEDVRVDRIEIASARVSEGEFKGAKRVFQWAAEKGHLEKVEALGFIDDRISLQWIADAGGKVVNLLCKGSLNHVMGQLRKSPEEHLADIQRDSQCPGDGNSRQYLLRRLVQRHAQLQRLCPLFGAEPD